MASIDQRSVTSRNIERPSRASRGIVFASAGVLALLTCWIVFSILLTPSSTTSAAIASRGAIWTSDSPSTPNATAALPIKNVKTLSVRQEADARREPPARQDDTARRDAGAPMPVGLLPILAAEPPGEQASADTPTQILAKAFAARQPGADALAMASEGDEAIPGSVGIPTPRQRPVAVAARGIPVPRPRPSIDVPEEVDQTLTAETERQRSQ